MPSLERPAIFQYEREDEDKGADRFTPPIVTMNVDLYIYMAPGKDNGIIPISIVNRLIDAPSKTTCRQTLGGLASHC